jgi:uncharacterized protein with FMN-binding domain
MGRVILAIVSTAACLVLLLSFKARSSSARLPPAPAITPATAAAPSHSPRPATGPTTSDGRPKAARSGSTSSTSSAAPTTVAGNVVQTIYGPVQVAITVTNRRITAARVPVYPNGSPRDQQINSYALPQLIQETVAADSATISAVSGASYTSQGYISSLQSAIDKAGL